jgi:hypothetical protein
MSANDIDIKKGALKIQELQAETAPRHSTAF